MSDWKEYKIEDIAEVQTGPFGSQLHMKDYASTGTPIITVEHLGENKVIHENLPLVTDADKARLKKYTLAEGDIVFSRVGSVDRRAYISKKEDGWMFSGRLLRVRCNKNVVNPKFLSYYFGQETFKEYIRQIAVGATMPSINTTILSEVELSIPPLTTQTIIANHLSILDDKIDLLTRQNRTLEQLAETYFRQWFVEEANEDWVKGTVGDLFTLQRGFDLPEQNRQIGEFPIVTASGINAMHFEYKVKAPGVTTGRSGTIGEVFYIDSDFWPLNTSLFVKEFKVGGPLFAYYFLKTMDLAGLNSGSAVPTLNRNDVHAVDTFIPPLELINRFEESALGLRQKISSNNMQINGLRTLRDTLLPKLMSGEIILNNL